MMNETARWAAKGAPARGRTLSLQTGRRLRSGMADAMSGLVMILALAAGLALAVMFAATLALIMALATGLLALSALAWRMRPRPAARHAVVQPRRGGHAWVAYGLDRPGR